MDTENSRDSEIDVEISNSTDGDHRDVEWDAGNGGH